MSDIVERLRELYQFAAQQKSRDWDEQDEIRDLFKYTFNVAYEAANEIERLREALYECARNLEEQVSASYWHVEQPFDANMQRQYDRDMARAHKAFTALREKK